MIGRGPRGSIGYMNCAEFEQVPLNTCPSNSVHIHFQRDINETHLVLSITRSNRLALGNSRSYIYSVPTRNTVVKWVRLSRIWRRQVLDVATSSDDNACPEFCAAAARPIAG